MKTLLLLGVGLYSPETVKKLHEVGLKIVFIQRKELFDKNIAADADEILLTDYRLPEFYTLANKLHEIWNFTGVLSLTEAGLEIAATLSQIWGLPGANLTTLEYLKNKGRMRELLNKHNFSKVDYAVCNTAEELTSFINANGLPVIMKPVDAGGSLGINLIKDLDQIKEALEQIQNYGFNAIVEEFIEGPEYSVESFSFEGEHSVITITEKQINEQFIEIGQIMPARLCHELEKEIEHTVISFLSLVGVTNGPCHTEIKISPKGIKIIESHNRIGGDYICKLIDLVYGVDVIKLSGLCACRMMTTRPSITKAKSAAVAKFATFKPGKISRIVGISQLSPYINSSIAKFELYYDVLDTIPELISNSERSGCIIVHDTCSDKALEKADHLLSQVEIEYCS